MEFYLKGTEIKTLYKTMDPLIGSTYQSNADINVNKEGFYMGKANSYGFVGNLNNYSKNDFKIVFFGDSYTEAFQLFDPYHFTNIIEKKLNTVQSEKVTVFNLGISNVLLKDIYIRKKRLASKFDVDLNVYFLNNIQFLDYPEGILNSLDLKFKNNKIQIVKSSSRSYLIYKKISFLFDNSSCTNLFLDMYLMHRRGLLLESVFDKFIQNDGNTFFEAGIISEKMYASMPIINSKILSELEKENTIFIFRESVNPNVKKLLIKYDIPFYETKSILDSIRDTGQNPYYWKRTKAIGHFNYQAHEKLASFMTELLLPYVESNQSKFD